MLGLATAQEVYFKAVEMIHTQSNRTPRKGKKWKLGKAKRQKAIAAEWENEKKGEKEKGYQEYIWEREREYMMGIWWGSNCFDH